MAAEACSVCAWRATCNKKFSISGRDVRCPDFSEDYTLKKGGDAPADEAPAAQNEQ